MLARNCFLSSTKKLRKLAAHRMAQEGPDQTLQPTALVHEAWLRMLGSKDHSWQGWPQSRLEITVRICPNSSSTVYPPFCRTSATEPFNRR